jgi:uncharacterized protein (DUF4415 family)
MTRSTRRPCPSKKIGAARGAGCFFWPIKKQLALRLDADLIDWFKTHAPQGEGYPTEINKALRAYVTQQDDAR